MFENYTFESIMDRMLNRITDDVDKREGSIIWDALAPAALELNLAYIMLDYIFQESFAYTADREFLILRAAERDLYPYEATSAVIKGVFTPSTVDVMGKRFNLGDLNFIVSKALETSGEYQLTCETPGVNGNLALGNMIPIEYVDGLQTAIATEVLIPGRDEEATEDFRNRYFESFKDRAFGGNIQDYIDKIVALDGVGSVRVIPVWQGGGTVLCNVLDANFDPATTALVQSVQMAMDPTQDGQGFGLAPIGHVVTVTAPNNETINLTLNIDFDTGYNWNNMISEITGTMESYLLEIRKAWGNSRILRPTVIRVSQIETRLLALPGIVDIRDTKINGQMANYTLTGNNVPKLGVISNGTGA